MFFEMEKGRSDSGTPMKSLDQRKHTESHDFNDVMYRRMKNRERQRRYRARKRLVADSKDSHVIISMPTPLPVPVEFQLTGNLNSYVTNLNTCVTHVHRRRDWKKDARRAHAAAKDKEDRYSGSFSPTQTLTSESQVLQSDDSPCVINCETRKTIPGRRDWKAAARNKKS